MDKLKPLERDCLRLVRRSVPDADGWYAVSAVLWGMVTTNIPADLIEKDETERGGRIRLTPRGQAVCDYL